MKLLILCTDYPSRDNPYKVAWAHARSKHYVAKGCDVTVLNFSSDFDYLIDHVRVVCYNNFDVESFDYDVVISHSPNIRLHFPFLYRIRNRSCRIVLFFHGSESLYQNKDYSKPYSYMRPSLISNIVRSGYDAIKMKVIKHFVTTTKNLSLVFVSQWMLDKVVNNTKINLKDVNYKIIPNCLSEGFYENKYSPSNEFKADFITLRKLDESKYAIDKVLEFAKSNPDYTFHIFGKGNFFNNYKIPSNVTWFDYYIEQNKLPKHLNNYRAALMPTRVDAQGVMSCEMAVYGIPLIVSDIFIMREMLDEFSNVDFIELKNFNLKRDSIPTPRRIICEAEDKFSYENTVEKELEFLAN